jgi:hypothetical protein
MFTMLDNGNKNFVCEHDLFQYMQNLNHVKRKGISDQEAIFAHE